MSNLSRPKVLFQLSGSVACYKGCHVISRLVQEGVEIQTVVSPAALKFIGAATLEGLTGRPVLSDMFESSQVMSHIELTKWADLSILCPATANRINGLASGAGNDLIGALFLAWDFNKPYLVAPAMNSRMLSHPATQASIARLKSWGLEILETETGRLACGEVGEGKLLDPDRIVEKVLATLQPRAGLKVLVTSGGTWEPIDGVRYLANQSTGRTGAAIAEYFAGRGHQVTCLHSSHGLTPKLERSSTISFSTFSDLDRSMRELLCKDEFDVVIHAAAVSDFSIDRVETHGSGARFHEPGTAKIDSGQDVSVRLKPNYKIVEKIKSYSKNPHVTLVAFKLTNTPDSDVRSKSVQKLSSNPDVDFVVHNDLSEVDSDGVRHQARIFRRDHLIAESRTNVDLAVAVERVVSEYRERKGAES